MDGMNEIRNSSVIDWKIRMTLRSLVSILPSVLEVFWPADLLLALVERAESLLFVTIVDDGLMVLNNKQSMLYIFFQILFI